MLEMARNFSAGQNSKVYYQITFFFKLDLSRVQKLRWTRAALYQLKHFKVKGRIRRRIHFCPCKYYTKILRFLKKP